MSLQKKSKIYRFSQKRLPSGNEILRLTFSMIFKKSTLEGVFDFFYPEPQPVQIFKPTGFARPFFYMYISIYEFIVYYILI